MTKYQVVVNSAEALIYEVEADSIQEAKDKVLILLDKAEMPDIIEDHYFDNEIKDVLEVEEEEEIEEEEDEMIRARIPSELCKEFKKYCIDKNTTIQDALSFMIVKVLK